MLLHSQAWDKVLGAIRIVVVVVLRNCACLYAMTRVEKCGDGGVRVRQEF